MKLYTLIGGVNGAGKSSLTGVLKAERTDLGRIIDPDRLTAQHGGALEGGREAIRQQEACLAAGLSFAQETTLSGIRTLRTVRRARDAGYFIRLFYVGLDSAEESIARIANRVRKGGHSIPEEDVRRRFAGRFEALCAVLPYCDEAVFYDNENGFRVVGEYRNGELLPVGSDLPRWFCELQAALDQN